jgi:hypothetical protein
MLEEIESAKGYVVQFLGDCVMAIWGAPDADADHAVHAAQAALAVARRIDAEVARAIEHKEWWFGVKIGLNTGPALVGNIGNETRYNFTAVGETVNVASRIEGVASAYSCPIAVGDETARRIAADFLLRELDTVVVKGRPEPMTVHQLIATHAAATPAQRASQTRYAEALARYRAGDFARAADLWDAMADEEPMWQSHAEAAASRSNPPHCMAARARRLGMLAPGEGWKGVWEMKGK